MKEIMINIYLGGPITGLSYEEATSWRTKVETEVYQFLSENFVNNDVRFLSPLRGKEYLKNESSLNKSYENMILSSKKSIVLRDGFDVDRCQICVFNFLQAKTVSIGSVWEIGRAHRNGSLVLVAVQEDNVHNHPMITQNSIVVSTEDELVEIIKKVI